MNRVEIKQWAKEKIKGHIWELLIPILVFSVLTNLTIGASYNYDNGRISVNGGYAVGIFFAFVEVGFASFMLNFIHDKNYNFKDLFSFTSDYIRIFVVKLLSSIFIFLWALLLIVPGIIKAYAYSLIPILLGNDKYKDLSYKEVLNKSEEIMNGHKMDLFMLDLSFIGWHLLAILTLGILEIWILPYYETARFKLLDEIMASAN